MQKKSSPPCKKSAAASSRTLCGALRRQQLRKVHTATVHQRLIPQFYEGELKGFCRLNGQDTAGIRIGEIGKLAASVFQDPRSQFFTVNSSNEVAFGLENHGLPQDKIRKKQGKTLLLSEHRLYYLADIADEFWVMADGEIKGKYTAAEAKAFSVERRQTLSLRTLDPCGDHRAGERAAAENRADGACRLRCLLYIRQEGRRYPLWCQLLRP